jgi:hypothetical protein
MRVVAWLPAATGLRLAPDGRITAAHRYKYLFLVPSHLSSSSFTLSPTATPSPTLGLSLTLILTAPHHHPHHPSHPHSHSHVPSSPHLHTVLAVPEPAAPCHRTCDSMEPVAPSHRKLGFQWDSSCRFCNDMQHHAFRTKIRSELNATCNFESFGSMEFCSQQRVPTSQSSMFSF